MIPGWLQAGVSIFGVVISAGVTFLVVHTGRSDRYRESIKTSIDALTEKVGKQNGRIGILEARVNDLKEDTGNFKFWNGVERRRTPRDDR